MLKTYISEVEIDAVKVEGDLRELCEVLMRFVEEAHPMWKIPGGFHPDKEPNAIMFKDKHEGWNEAHLGDYIVKVTGGGVRVPGDIFDMFFNEVQ